MSLFESVIKCSDEELDNIITSSLQEKKIVIK